MFRKLIIGVGAIAVVAVGMGSGGAAGAATPPQPQLVMPQGTAFSILGHDCGGIKEYAYVTGFDNTIDPAAGYPTGSINLSTHCGGSGKGGGPGTTYTAWTSDTWDLTGALISYAPSGIPTVSPSFSATDPLTGNQIFNSPSPCPGTGGTGSTAYACLQWASTFTPRPRVVAISPTFGPATGSTAVTIYGDGFTAATTVDFGGTSVPFTFVNDSTITATSPVAAPGTVDVTVISPGGTSFTSTGDQFTAYGRPSVTGVKPNRGPITGDYTVTVIGTHFVGTTGVMAGDQAAGFQVVNDGTISVFLPPGDGGIGDQIDITVTSPGGTSPVTPADQFTYTGPRSVAISPNRGFPGQQVLVSGANFSGGEKVTIAYKTGMHSPKPVTVTICTAVTTAIGRFTCKGKVPPIATAGAKGLHLIVATGATGDVAKVSFTLL